MNSPLQGNALRDGLPWSGGSFHNPEPFKPPSDTATTLVSALRVAHLIAQNARNHTDTDKPDRHTALNPRALAVQADTPDRFLWSGGPKVPSSNLGSPTNKTAGQDRSLGVGPPGFVLALHVPLHTRPVSAGCPMRPCMYVQIHAWTCPTTRHRSHGIALSHGIVLRVIYQSTDRHRRL